MLSIEELKRRMPKSAQLFPQKGDSIVIVDGVPVSFYVLFHEYSSKGFWVHPCGVHFVEHKMTVCSELENQGPCEICERIRGMKNLGMMTFHLEAPMKYAMNVLPAGEETPKVFLAPESAARPIIAAFEEGLKEDFNIFDPLCTVPWVVVRTKKNGKTVYHVAPDARIHPGPIITGDNIEARIEKILKSGANFDVRYRLPFRP